MAINTSNPSACSHFWRSFFLSHLSQLDKGQYHILFAIPIADAGMLDKQEDDEDGPPLGCQFCQPHNLQKLLLLVHMEGRVCTAVRICCSIQFGSSCNFSDVEMCQTRQIKMSAWIHLYVGHSVVGDNQHPTFTRFDSLLALAFSKIEMV